MKEISVDKVKEIALSILIDVADFCEEHNLRYYLAYGTLLGAIRHKGFIPWDDDIDIQMPRDDYDKFIEIYNSENKSNKYRLVCPDDADAKHTFVKVIDTNTVKIESGTDYTETGNLGIDIDVFPIDGQPDDVVAFVRFYNKKRFYYKIWNYLISDRKQFTPIQKIRYFAIRIIYNKTRLIKIIDKQHRKYDYNESRYVGTTASLFNSIRNRFEKEWYDESVYVEFEQHLLRAPKAYDKILEKRYGDYMQLPPPEQQKTHHYFTAFILNE